MAGIGRRLGKKTDVDLYLKYNRNRGELDAGAFTDDKDYINDISNWVAGLLIPLVMHDSGPTVLLTRRTAHLHDHGGQISFPGGGIEHHDETAVAAALRETEEEVGLRADSVEVLGSLPRYATATGYVVTPVVGLVTPGYSLEIDSFEVEEVFDPPLAFLMDPAHHERRLVDFDGMRRTFYAMPYEAGRRYFIWGATAAMLRNFYHLLRA